MSLNVRSLAKSTLNDSANASLYEPASGKAAIVKSIRLVNTGTVAVTVNLSVRRGISGSGPRIGPKDLSIPPGCMYSDDEEVTLEGGNGTTTQDHILGWAASGQNGLVEYVISGVERDQT